jgi:quercetin dioxygenase-like cupin family protein
MSSGTTIAVGEVDGRKATEYGWGSIQWLVNGELVSGAALTFGYVEIAAGSQNPRHRHPNCDEVLYLMEGELEHAVGADVARLTPGMAIFIPQDVEHEARNTGTVTARMVVAYSSGERQTVLADRPAG